MTIFNISRLSAALGVSFVAVFTFGSVWTYVLIGGQTALADAGAACHFHGNKPAAESTVLDCATKRKEKLIAQKKIEASWKDVLHDSVSQVDGKNGKEWRLTYKNASSQDKSKETLYMFFSLTGNFIAANFTGK